jgi:hypothetical protein
MSKREGCSAFASRTFASRTESDCRIRLARTKDQVDGRAGARPAATQPVPAPPLASARANWLTAS